MFARTIDEDPAGPDYLRRVFDKAHGSLRPKATRRAWARAQAQDALSASPIGRALGAQVGLVPGGGQWHAEAYIPFLNGGIVEQTGSRTPLAALARLERHYRLLVIEAGAHAIVERERWATAHSAEAAASPDSVANESADVRPKSDG
jgi:hypothetical protein